MNEITKNILFVSLFFIISVVPGIIAHIITRFICKKKNRKMDRSLYILFYCLIPVCMWAILLLVPTYGALKAPQTIETDTYDLICIENTNVAKMHWSNSQSGQIYFYYNDGNEDILLRCPVNKNNIIPSETQENTLTVTTYTFENKFLDFLMGTNGSYTVSLSDESLVYIFKADYGETT